MLVQLLNPVPQHAVLPTEFAPHIVGKGDGNQMAIESLKNLLTLLQSIWLPVGVFEPMLAIYIR